MIDTGENPIPQQPDTQHQTGLTEGIQLLMKDAKVRREPTSHVHKNDKGYGYIISEITEDSVSSEKTKVGLVVGNGAILSSLPNIPADIIVLTDYNPFIQEWTHFSSEALLRAETTDEYRQSVYSEQNPLYKELQERGVRPEAGLEAEIADLGEQHFLASETRFRECKQALQRKQLLDFAVDLTDRSTLQGFSDTLERNNAEITFANMTNVWEHAGNGLEDSLPILPFSPQAIMLSSSRTYSKDGQVQMMGVKRGIHGYIDLAKPAYNFEKNHRHRY